MKKLIRNIFVIVLMISLIGLLMIGALVLKSGKAEVHKEPTSNIDVKISDGEVTMTKEETADTLGTLLAELRDESLTKEQMLDIINKIHDIFADIEYYNQYNVDEHVSRLLFQLENIIQNSSNLAESRQDINDILDTLDKDYKELKEIPNKHEDE